MNVIFRASSEDSVEVISVWPDNQFDGSSVDVGEESEGSREIEKVVYAVDERIKICGLLSPLVEKDRVAFSQNDAANDHRS